MKKVFLFLLTATLIVTSCQKGCGVRRPRNVNSIDWNNYNDVYTVYWNLSGECSKENRRYNEDSVIIKVSGWKAWSYDRFSLCDDPKYANQELGYTGASPIITVHYFGKDSLFSAKFNEKMDTSDLTKKCYITGRIFMKDLPKMFCCRTVPQIHLNSVDDIYFK
ncbi:MAG: hypothetical protein LBQ64_03460 [Bacteroidales bacterium]|nr:hypothetical protein [Bacteroidales bacterium]